MSFDDIPDDNEVEDVRSIISDDVNDDECFTLDELKNFDLNEIKLNEGITDIVYHFTNLDSLASIGFDNSFRCGWEHSGYFMSTTRQKSPLIGFPSAELYNNNNCVRLTLDGCKLKESGKIIGKPFAYFKEPKINLSHFPEVNKFISLKDLSDDESEDRIYPIKGNKIQNAASYILRVDIYIDTNSLNRFTFSLLEDIKQRLNTLTFNVYTQYKDFAIQNNKFITIDEFINVYNV